jgi:hypothetical protein
MKLFKSFQLFKESILGSKVQIQNEIDKPKSIYKPKNLVAEICVSMTLLNNNFLDNILDRGMKARYSENSQVFLTDLKNLLLGKNRLCLGKYQNDKFIEDEEISKISGIFESVDFSLEEDWNTVVDSRITARNIIDKLLMTEKLEEDLIRKIYWIGPNKTKEISEDIVIETTDGRQFSFYLNKNISTSKTASFLSFADDLIGTETEKLYGEELIKRWDKLVQNWIRICYENSNTTFQAYFEKFVEPSRINDIGWFRYFEIKHKDPKFQNLGEYFKEFDSNIVFFSDFLDELWKNRDTTLVSVKSAEKDWLDKKMFLLNSKIIEHLLTQSIKKNNPSDVKKLEDGFKKTSGTIKMKLVKTLVEKLNCQERSIYYLGNKGNSFHILPPRSFFRKFYDDISIKFDYHVRLIDRDKFEDNNFRIKMKIELDDELLMDCLVIVKFSGSELGSKLSATYKFEPSDNFDYIITEKMKDSDLKLLENFGEKITFDYLKSQFPINLDTKYQELFDRERYYINIDGDVYYYSFDEKGEPAYGFNRLKQVLLNILQSDNLITDIVSDTQLIKQYLKSI